jgi:hypothetical protein
MTTDRTPTGRAANVAMSAALRFAWTMIVTTPLLFTACAAETTSPGEGSSASATGGTTFCAVLRIAETKCVSRYGGGQTDVTLEKCVENLPSCAGLTGKGSVSSDSSDDCVTTTTFKLTAFNDDGPYPATCEAFKAYRAGRLECLGPRKDMFGNPLGCEGGKLVCGATHFVEPEGPMKETCSGLDAVTTMPACENGTITMKTFVTRRCVGGCTVAPGNDFATCSQDESSAPPPGR